MTNDFDFDFVPDTIKTSNTLDLTELNKTLGHLGCHEPAARGIDAIETWETSEGLVTLASQSERFTAELDWVMQRLEDLEPGCGSDAVFDALNADDDPEDDGQPTDLQEQAYFAGDDNW